MIDGDHGLSITQQAKALGISRGSVYYLPRPVSPGDLAVIGGWTNSISSSPSREAVCYAIF